MANTIRIKRRPSSGSAGAPSSASLYNGELAFNENDNTLYYAYGSGVGGISTAVPAIAGSGAYALRGGTNATGTWPISVNGNSASVTNGVYTTGDQNINGRKTFGDRIIISHTGSFSNIPSLNIGGGGDNYFDYYTGQQSVSSGYLLAGLHSDATTAPFRITFDLVGGAAITNGEWRASTIAVDKGGTGQTSYSNGQLLIGSGTSLAANTLTAGTGISIANGSGTITINNSRTGSTSIVVSSLEYQRAALTGDVTASQNNNATTIANDAVTNAKAANMAVNTIKGRITAGTGDPEDLTAANVRTIINVEDGANNYSHPTQTAITESNANGKVLSAVSVNTLGHVTSIGTKTLAEIDIPALSTDKLTSGTLGVNRGGTGATTLTAGNILIGNGTSAISAPYSVETTLIGGTGALPRADAVKTYVDNMIGSGIATNDAMIFKGTIDCSTNPNYPAADRGWVYKINGAGRIGGASGPVVEVNDTIICATDGSPSGIHSVVGGNWNILQTNIVDSSILVTGPTSATSGNIPMFDGTTGKIIKDGGFLASDIARLGSTQTFTGVNSFGAINAGYQVSSDPALTIYDDVENIGLRVMSDGSVTVGTWNATTIAADKGGTGQSSYTIGDLLYADTATTLAKLADVATGNVLLAGGVSTAPSWGKVGLTTHVSGTLPVANGGTNQTSYTNGQLLIGNSTGNTLTKATLTQGTAIDITNGTGSITIGHNDTSTLTGAQGSNGIASFTVDGMGHVTAVTTATYLTAGTVCAAIVDCTLDGGTF